MSTYRDRVLFYPNERVDLGDLEAMQNNARTDLRASLSQFLMGDAPDTYALTQWLVEQEIVPTSTVKVTRGTALGAELRDDPDGTVEFGVPFGAEGVSTLHPSFVGLPAATYGIYVRFLHVSGSSGTRRFYNPGTELEESQGVDTRDVAGWEAAVSASSPGDEWHKVASVVWGGATVVTANISGVANYFFEGSDAANFVDFWGDGVNDRNTDRAAYGIGDLYTWVQAVRRQLNDIIGGVGWYSEPDTSLSAVGAAVTAHLADDTDPHGADLTQTNLQVDGNLTLTNRPLCGEAVTRVVSHHSFRWDPAVAKPPSWPSVGGAPLPDQNALTYATLSDTSSEFILEITDLIGRGGVISSLSFIYLYIFHKHADVDATLTWSLQKRALDDPWCEYTEIDSGTIGASVTSLDTPEAVSLSPGFPALTEDEVCRLVCAFVNTTNDQIYLSGAKLIYVAEKI